MSPGRSPSACRRCAILGMAVGSSEAEPSSLHFLRPLRRRGPAAIKLVVFDAYKGLKTVTKVLGAAWRKGAPPPLGAIAPHHAAGHAHGFNSPDSAAHSRDGADHRYPHP